MHARHSTGRSRPWQHARPCSASRETPLARDDGVGEVYTAHGGKLYRFALRSLGDVGAAQDVVAETFLHAWRAADEFIGAADVEIRCNMNASVLRADATGFSVWDSDGTLVLNAEM